MKDSLKIEYLKSVLIDIFDGKYYEGFIGAADAHSFFSAGTIASSPKERKWLSSARKGEWVAALDLGLARDDFVISINRSYTLVVLSRLGEVFTSGLLSMRSLEVLLDLETAQMLPKVQRYGEWRSIRMVLAKNVERTYGVYEQILPFDPWGAEEGSAITLTTSIVEKTHELIYGSEEISTWALGFLASVEKLSLIDKKMAVNKNWCKSLLRVASSYSSYRQARSVIPSLLFFLQSGWLKVRSDTLDWCVAELGKLRDNSEREVLISPTESGVEGVSLLGGSVIIGVS